MLWVLKPLFLLLVLPAGHFFWWELQKQTLPSTTSWREGRCSNVTGTPTGTASPLSLMPQVMCGSLWGTGNVPALMLLWGSRRDSGPCGVCSWSVWMQLVFDWQLVKNCLCFPFPLLSFRILLSLVCAESPSEQTLFFLCFNLFIFLLCTFQQS